MVTTPTTLTSTTPESVSGTAGNDFVYVQDVADLVSTDVLYGLGGIDTIQFLHAGTILGPQFTGVHGFEDIELAAGNNTINLSNHLLAQVTPGDTLDVTSGDSGTTIFNLRYLTTGTATLTDGGGNDKFELNASQLSDSDLSLTIAGSGGTNTLILYGGGDIDLRQETAITDISDISRISLNNSDFFLTLAQSGTTVYMGGGEDTVVVGPAVGRTLFHLGAFGQTAIGGSGNDVFYVTTAALGGEISGTLDIGTGGSDPAPEATTINGEGGVNTLVLDGTGSFSSFDLGDLDLISIQRITTNNAAIGIYVDNAPQNMWSQVNGLTINIGTGNDLVDLRGFCNETAGVVRLEGGNGSDVVYVGAAGQVVTLGNGGENVAGANSYGNTVLISGADLDGIAGPHQIQPVSINGGSGVTNAINGVINSVGNDSLNTLVITDDGCGSVIMSEKIVGFHAVDLGFYDSGDLNFFGEGCGPYQFFIGDASFVANDTAGLVVYGTTEGGDCVTLNATDQSYIAGSADAAGELNNEACAGDNTVILNAGGLTAAANGTVLDGGGGGDNTLEITSGGTYDFNLTNVIVENFQTVQVDAGATAITLDLNSSAYTVNIEAPNGSAADDVVITGEGNDVFSFYGTGTFTGTIDGGGKGSSITINSGANTDLSGLTNLTDLGSIHIDDNGTLTLTSTQIAALDAQPAGFTLDCSSATLIIDVVGQNFNLAALDLQGFEVDGNTIEIVDNNSGDTIYGGPQNNQIIVLGTGNDWINAGSGNTVVEAGYQSGSHAVLIAGNGDDTFVFGTRNQAMVTDDTIIGPQPTGSGEVSGALTVAIADSATVDFTGGTLSGNTFTGTAFPDIEYVDAIVIRDYATAIFTLEELNGLGTLNPGVKIMGSSATLEIVADSSISNVVTTADLYTYTGDVLIDVTGLNTNPDDVPDVTVDVSGITNDVTIDANSGYETITLNNAATDVVNVGNGVETINAGTGTDTAVFDIANFQSSDDFVGDNGTYTFEIEANTDLTAGTFSGSYTSPINVEIAPGTILRLAASDLTAVPDGVSVGTIDGDFYGGNKGHLYVDLSNAVDTASNIPADKDTTTFNQGTAFGSPGGFDTTDIDMTIYGSNSGDTITLDVAGLQTSVFDGSGADHVTFTVGLSNTLADTISLGLGQNTLELSGGTSETPVVDDFTGSTLSQISTEQIDSYDKGIFYSQQVDGSTANVTDNAVFTIDVQNESVDGAGREFFSLQNVSVGPITGSANLLLNLTGEGSGVVNIYADAGSNDGASQTGDDIVAGMGTENIYDGGGGDHIQAGQNTDNVHIDYGFASASVADEVLGWSAVGGTLNVDFDNTAPNGNTHQWNVQGALETFSVDPVTVNGEEEVMGTTLYIEANTDLTGATLTNIAAMTVENAADLVLTDSELEQFAVTPAVDLTTMNPASDLTIDVADNFAPINTADVDLNNWTGSVTIQGNGVGNQTIDASGLDLNIFTPQDLYIYAGTGNDTITGTDNGGDHLIGAGGNDTFRFLGGDATNDVVNGNGGTNTIEITGLANAQTDYEASGYSAVIGDNSVTDFGTAGSISAGSISNVQDVHFDKPTISGATGDLMVLTSTELVGDQASLTALGTGPLTLSDAGGNYNYTLEIDATGNVDVSGIDVDGFGSVGGTFRSVLYVDDDNSGSVTVVGSNNGLLSATATAGTLSTDILQVNGYGDTVQAGTGATEAIFENYNVANNFQYNGTADLGNATAANGSVPLALEGDLVRGLADGSETIDGSSGHRGYLDLTGFTGVNSAVNTTPTHDIDLGGGEGFGSYGVVEDNDIIAQTFITGGTTADLSTPNTEAIFAAGVGLGATEIETQFTDSQTNKGFITVWDNNNDFALFYVNHNATTNGSRITASEIQLVGVFDTVDGVTLHDGVHHTVSTPGTVPVLSQLFFHIH